MDNAEDPKAIARKAERQRSAAASRDLALKDLFATAYGRKFLWDELAWANIFAQVVDTGPGGHATMCFAEGKRAYGLRLLADLQRLSPQAYQLMTVENAKAKLEEPEDGGRSDD